MTIKKNTITFSKNETLAIAAAEAVIAVSGMQAKIDTTCATIHKALKGKTLGTVKSGDAVMIRFTETLAAANKSEQTVKNYATAFRKSCNEGTGFSMNAYRARPNKTGAKTGGKNSKTASSDSIVIKITGKPSETDVAKAMREAVNSEAFRDQYASLAAFITDALDEFDGE